ncbi:unnamed protein product [Rodentolepis nana]|uniref:Aspartyl aminopeptidase n=1 Tax=Rodentolepis nana TaxID=102285 RepID=A0A0R3TN06_RODNA|nr:unnamed protein product [Rodentolepis nana]
MVNIDPNTSSNGGLNSTSSIDIASSNVTDSSSTVVSMASANVSGDISLLSLSSSNSTSTTTNSSTDGVVKTESFSNAPTSNPVITSTPTTTTTATRSPPLKRPRHKPGERKELLERAVRDVKMENISMRKAASRYNLAKSSLCDYVRKNHIVLPNNRCRPSATASAAAAATAANNSNSTNHQNHLGGGSLLSAMQQQSLNHAGGEGLLSLSVESMRNAHPTTAKLESPWSNVPGLPTQVPMHNWSSFPLTSFKTLGGLSHISSAPSPKQQHNELSSSDPHSPLEDSFNGNTAVNTSSSTSFICTPLTSDTVEGQSITSTAPFFNSAPATAAQLLNSSNVDAARSLATIYAASTQQQNNSNSNNANSQLTPNLLPTMTQSTPTLPNAATVATSVPLVFPNSDTSVLNESLQRFLLAARGQANFGDLFLPPPSPSPMVSCFSSIPAEMRSKLNLPNILNSLISANTTDANSSTNAPVISSASCSAATAAAVVIDNAIARMPHSQKVANDLIRFINMSPTPFHVVQSAVEMLKKAGFCQLLERDVWNLQPNDCVFVTKNQSTLFAVAVGGAYKPGEGFSMIGAHTDSPCLRLKPISKRVKEGFVQLGVQTYGAGLWYTWFDRELTLAGRVIVRNPNSSVLEERLIHINRPLACVPSLAIHFNRNVNTGFAPDPENHLAPIISTTVMEQLNGGDDDENSIGGHPSGLMRLIATELQCATADIVDLELYLAATQPACVGGLHGEFIHAPRLDNQFSAFTSLSALVNSLPSLKDDPNIRVVCLYDHEEIGSESCQGAASVLTEHFLRRIIQSLVNGAAVETADSNCGGSNAMDTTTSSPTTEGCLFERSLARSFFLSADQSHAVHPSWPEKHEPAHKPAFHQGLVLKHNVTQRYATNGQTSAIVKEIAKRSNVPLQEFVTRQDAPCGATIGPIIASHLGVMTADIGGPQLAMHSCREITCTSSVGYAVALFTGYFDQLANIMTGYVNAK